MNKIHIEWDGPFSLEQIKTKNKTFDYGIYQAYGKHSIYGCGVLLYIGQANYQTFGKRIPQHEKWGYVPDTDSLEFYIGRLGGNTEISDSNWQEQIDVAEKLLIFTHSPAYNCSNIQSIKNVPIDTHVYNWGNHRSLFPEVSAFRYMATYDEHFPTYNKFGSGE